MAPKGLKGKAAKPLFDKVAGSICGMQYTLYENGVLLREFAATLRVGQVVAVHAARADQNMEGSYCFGSLACVATRMKPLLTIFIPLTKSKKDGGW